MTETRYRLTPANIPITILQGTTYYQRWQLRYKTTLLPFPLFDANDVALWKGRCQFRSQYSDTTAKLSLTTEENGVVLDVVTNDDLSKSVFYAIYATAAQTAALPSGKLYYDIELERLTDGWVIRPQQGKATVSPEATKAA